MDDDRVVCHKRSLCPDDTETNNTSSKKLCEREDCSSFPIDSPQEISLLDSYQRTQDGHAALIKENDELKINITAILKELNDFYLKQEAYEGQNRQFKLDLDEQRAL